MAGITGLPKLPTSTVYGVSTFYTQFKPAHTGKGIRKQAMRNYAEPLPITTVKSDRRQASYE